MKDYSEDIKIDRNNLEKEFEKQPTLVMECNELLTNKMEERDNAKLALAVLEAQIDDRFRKTDPGLKEAAIKNKIISDPERIAKVKEVNRLTKEYNLYKAASDSFRDKKKALATLADLHKTGYYSGIREIRSEIRSGVDPTRIKQNKG